MPEENNKIVERFEATFAANDVATINELCAQTLSTTTRPDQRLGLPGFRDTIAMYKAVFPDLRSTLSTSSARVSWLRPPGR